MLKTNRPMWAGPTAKLVERIYGSNSPASVFVTKAREILHEARQTKPPIDPFALARTLGVQVEERPMNLDGFIEKNDAGQFVVVLKSSAASHRKRFTLCHELAHTFFFDDLAHNRAFRSQDQYDPEEERLCNLAAAEMLMPFAVFNQDLLNMKEHDSITPNTVFGLMDRYGVSLQAVSNRISWIVRDSAFILWRCEDAAINPEWASPAKMKRVVLCQTGHTSVEKACASPGFVFKGPDSFYGIEENLIRRWTSSRRLSSGQVFSVLTRRNADLSAVPTKIIRTSCTTPESTESKPFRAEQLTFLFDSK